MINSCFITHTKHNRTSAQRILTGIHRLPVTNRERSAFSCASNCQGQLQTPQSVSIRSTHSSGHNLWRYCRESLKSRNLYWHKATPMKESEMKSGYYTDCKGSHMISPSEIRLKRRENLDSNTNLAVVLHWYGIKMELVVNCNGSYNRPSREWYSMCDGHSCKNWTVCVTAAVVPHL